MASHAMHGARLNTCSRCGGSSIFDPCKRLMNTHSHIEHGAWAREEDMVMEAQLVQL